MSNINGQLHEALRTFASTLTEKLAGTAAAEPEAQLHGPILEFLRASSEAIGYKLLIQAESRAPDRIGIPDFAVSHDKLLIGYVELKAPGTGANTTRFTGRNRQQWQRFQNLPNLLYTDGTEWALYQNGERVGRVVRLSGDAAQDGAQAAVLEDAEALSELLRQFLSWEVIPPKTAKQLASLLAPICRMLRDQVADALTDQKSPLVRLAFEWREHLFPEASDERFADAYAQTVTYALLLARAEGGNTLDIHDAAEALEGGHTMLARALQVMTDPQAEMEIRPALRLVQRVVAGVRPDTFVGNGKTDPWLYFYEDFLAEYDAQLRKNAGAYYTPVEVVHAQVRLVDQLITCSLGMTMGLAEGNGVVILDPAAGTGTYLLGVIDHAMARVREEEGQGAARARASLLWQNIHGFEFMVSPYAVAELRLAQAMLRHQGKAPGGDPPVYLTNTLESPYTKPPAPPLFYEPIAKEHHRALQVKDRIPVMVCIGNPPYDRHEASTAENKARTGAWIRWGDDGEGLNAPLNDYIEPARQAGYGGALKNLYNLYVYFWRWAFWKAFEHEQTARGPGIVSYISASSYLEGNAFVGMREHMRRICDEIWIIDLGGEGRGTRKTENVFDIQTPVAIAIAVRYGRTADSDTPAKVNYSRLEGARDAKLRALDNVREFADLEWDVCPSDWHAHFKPAGVGAFFDWPLITDLIPWQVSGAQIKRIWPVAPDRDTLERRWARLLDADDRATAFKETRDRKINRRYPLLFRGHERHRPIAELSAKDAPPEIRRYSYRSFDRQWILADNRLGDYMRPVLWQAYCDRQLYFTTLLNHPLGSGPALTVAAHVPDLHHFRGSFGAKEVMPLFRDADAEHPNVLPGLLELLGNEYGFEVSAEDWAAYLYGIMAHPAYTERYADELEHRELRAPLTRDAHLFEKVVDIGRRLIWLHTYGERMVPANEHRGHIPKGEARCTAAVSDTPDRQPETFEYDTERSVLRVGDGEFWPVSPEVWRSEVSGLHILGSWLGYRMKNGSGKRSSPLDDIAPQSWTAEFTSELLRLLWILEHTLAIYPEQGKLFERVLSSGLFHADDLPAVPECATKMPKTNEAEDLFRPD